GRLPDVSIAESLARLPGIASQRTNGQSSAINIRGLSQALTFTTLNGREQVTPNGNRSIEFEQFPSELIAGVDVYKSPKASLIEGGVGGTVELKTVRPLDIAEPFRVNANIRGSFNDRAGDIFSANEFGYRLSGSFVGKFANDTIGVAVGYARLEQPDVSTRFVGFDFGGPDPNNFIDNNGDGVDDLISFGFEVEEQGGNETRDGVFGALQWEPNENFSVTLDGYYSNFESESFGRGIRVIGPQEIGSGNTGIIDPVFNGNTVVGGTIFRNTGAPTAGGGFGLTFQNINDNQFDQDELISLGGNVEWTTGPLTTTFDFTYSSAESFFANEVANILPIVSLDGGVPGVSNSLPATPVIGTDQQVTFLVNSVTEIPQVDFANDFTDRSLNRLSSFGAFPFENDDELFAYALDFDLDVGFGPIASIEAGVRYSEREASQFRESAGFGFGNDAGFFQFAGMPFTPIELTADNSEVECFEGNFADAGFPCFLVIPDPRALFESENGPIVLDQSAGFTVSDSFVINEDVIAGYLQLNIDTELGGIPVTGNVGLRVVNTDQSSINQAQAGAGTIGPLGQNFTEYLPSANLVFRVTEDDQIRIGGSRTMARPSINSLGAGVNASLTNQVPEGVTPTGDPNEFFITGGSSGNPFLDPILSNNFDLSYEHYFEGGGIFTTAFFFKDLESVFFNDTITGFDFEEAGLLPLVNTDPNFAAVNGFVGNFGSVANAGGGTILGIEVAYTQVFEFLPAPFDGLGASVNYTWIDSSIEVAPSFLTGEAIETQIPGFSEHVFNPTIFFDYGGFSTRVSGRYRSDFVSPQIGLNQQLPMTDDELVIDYQASYVFPEDSALEGLTILFQANNVTDEPVSTFFGPNGQIGTIQFFGRQFFFGLSYAY
ncbi:MAG: TonB-dependent receptor, partial [Pseudomonadota bacterium]